MSDNETPPNESASTLVDRLQLQTLRDLEELLREGGKRTMRWKCRGCGAIHVEEVQVADAELHVKVASMLSAVAARQKSGGGDDSAAVAKLLRDRSEMTDAELAERIVQLKAELGRE